ncbi:MULTISPECIES: hypothetical protein [Burkholderia]|uniref:hypothetical protein n=1 Tax=Burkholderia TaxID=32008 RepID=UPI000B79BA9D|nr:MULTISPECIES: hypothetical protein [Burkholderia]MBY4728876.1 hypothetical protein [Burkholderia contaminans]MCI3968256.1 hypothetical protein [Burkholderia sp. HI4860]OXI92251.1 hypothetical protein CFB48_37345 [Burkholderia sp. AU33647]
MKIIEDGNFTWSVSIFLVLVGFVVMFGFLKYGPPSVLSALMVCVGFGIAAVGGMTRETLINGPTSEVAGEMASNFLDDEANRRSIQ